MQELGTAEPESSPPADYAGLIAAWIAETVPQLESHLLDGTLADLLQSPEVQEVLGPELLERYRIIAAEKLRHDLVFRRNWTVKLVEDFQQSLQTPRILFPAQPSISSWRIHDPFRPALAVRHRQGDVTLRPDQVLSARRWGIWFHFENEALEGCYQAFLVNRARQCLASQIANLWHIEATYLSQQSNLGPDPPWHTEPRGARFEHFMNDVLNEFAPVARRAPLAEDILERTDLRVIYPSVQRENGARVQVSLVARPADHDHKVRALSFPDEFIVLTPLELARCAVHPPGAPTFAAFAWSDFWAALGGPWREVHALARELHNLFIVAVSRPLAHPLGPMWHLAPPLRQFIRLFTEHHAAKTTNSVRERMTLTKQPMGSVDKYTSRHWKAKFTRFPAGEGIGPAKPTAAPTQQIEPKAMEGTMPSQARPTGALGTASR